MFIPPSIHAFRGLLISIGPDKKDKKEENKNWPWWVWILIIIGMTTLCYFTK